MDALSQKDIDSLLKGAAPDAPTARGPEVIPYNFLRPPRISKERGVTLEAIHTRFAGSLQALLSSRLRQAVDVTLVGVEQATFAEFLFAIEQPCAAFVFTIADPVGGQAVIDVSPGLAYLLVDRQLGGTGEAGDVRRPLTALEQLVVGGVTERVMGLLRDAWGEHLPFQATPESFESSPETIQIANREDNVLVANVEIRSGGVTGFLTVCIPLASLESFLKEKSAGVAASQRLSEADLKQARRVLGEHVRRVHVPLTVRFPVFHLRARDIAALAPGQIIQTGQATETPVQVLVGNRPRFYGTLGQFRGHVGVSLTDPIDARDSNPNVPRGKIQHDNE